MELVRLIEALAHPAAYPFDVDAVEVHHTHISVVFLAGSFAYKIKKPVRLPFLDFSTLDKRLHYCREEVRLNRRLAPAVYLDVVPIARTATGVLVEGQGDVVDWAVKMTRLPQEASLEQRLARGQVDEGTVAELGRRLAFFHASAATGPDIVAAAQFDLVAQNARDNFEQSRDHVGVTVSSVVLERLRTITDTSLERLRPRIEQRVREGRPRDTHGDLHLDHVYLFPDCPAPQNLVIVDCIEFNERFRYADPIADMAFLAMDFIFHCHRRLARSFADAYFQAAADEPGRALLPFFMSYRAAVRAKVEGMEAQEIEVPASERSQAVQRARAHWLLALGELEEPSRRPALVLIGGLPGSGKSTLARGLAESAGFEVIRSDVVRKELTGDATLDPDVREARYAPSVTREVYAECLRRAENYLFEGRRVLVDASFKDDLQRSVFLEAAARWAVPAVFLVCRVDVDQARARLAQRRGDASDADWSVYLNMVEQWQPPSSTALPIWLSSANTPEQTRAQALDVLRTHELL